MFFTFSAELILRMKKEICDLTIVLLIFLIAGFASCKQSDNALPKDERNDVTGTYSGIIIESGWTGESGSNFYHDTSKIVCRIDKLGDDSVICFICTNDSFSFYYHKPVFTSFPYYHPPTLHISNDTIFFHHQPALGPYWTDVICKKDTL